MGVQFTVLASGSGGNASLLEVDGFGLLLDIGLGPRQLANRLAAVGSSWHEVHAVLLTHTHSDHWKDTTLRHLCRRRLPLYCHEEHQAALLTYGSAFTRLHAAHLVRSFEAGVELVLSPGLRCWPLALRHDGRATFGFRFEGPGDFFGQPSTLGYAADLGSWTPDLAQALADVDLLALEFNHDVQLECTSGRSPALIARVLGDQGHLSNVQAAALLREIVRLSAPGRLQQVVQLHLSRDCNRPALAAEAARAVLAHLPELIPLHTASQDEPGPTFALGKPAVESRPARPSVRRRRTSRSASQAATSQPWLPGLGEW